MLVTWAYQKGCCPSLPRSRFRSSTTFCGVTSAPEWKRTPLRSLNLQTVESLFDVQDSASFGTSLPDGSTVTSDSSIASCDGSTHAALIVVIGEKVRS